MIETIYARRKKIPKIISLLKELFSTKKNDLFAFVLETFETIEFVYNFILSFKNSFKFIVSSGRRNVL